MRSLETRGSNFVVQFSFKMWKWATKQRGRHPPPLMEPPRNWTDVLTFTHHIRKAQPCRPLLPIPLCCTLSRWRSEQVTSANSAVSMSYLSVFCWNFPKTSRHLFSLPAVNQRAPATESRDMDGAKFKGRLMLKGRQRRMVLNGVEMVLKHCSIYIIHLYFF